MEKTAAYVENFLDYIQVIYYSDKEFSAAISDKLITTFKKIGTDNLIDAIRFFYEHNEEFDYIMDTSDKDFVNEGYKLGYLLGIWYNSYQNGCVHVKKRTNDEIIKEVC